METEALEKAKDKRNAGGLSLNAASGETQEPFVRIGQKMVLGKKNPDPGPVFPAK